MTYISNMIKSQYEHQASKILNCALKREGEQSNVPDKIYVNSHIIETLYKIYKYLEASKPNSS